MPRAVVLTLVSSLLVSTLVGASTSAVPAGPASREVAGWAYVDLPLADFGDDGEPYRFTFALPSRADLVTRMLFASEARWTLSAGYARVRDSYDARTGAFKNPGGRAALFGAARQFRWHPPRAAGATVPQLVIEFGAHYATQRFPADGTRLSLLLVTGLEWTWRSRAAGTEWTAALVWPHLSNANLFQRNAGYDGLALRFGRSLRF
jgi:hypothetical protein